MRRQGPTESRTPFKPWQWAEIGILVLVLAARLYVRFVTHALVATVLLGLAFLALLIHVLTWMLPMMRRRREGARSGR